ncbi:hypothetical protein [Cyanobacterium aponinum]|uniref:hypothetical protein n=1 Tax=Cyanobacterium aponinum TaxID=379064 RepID=UPI000C129CBF|nr:hypothetical protein [Cyanobacterium aponinum]PHV62104.1 hypothetical protein CSQ80_12170 [Cyanobacterium aponinum IPPAS B-1201]
MTKLVVLNLGAGNLNNGFPHIIARLRANQGTIEQQFVGSLPPAPELENLNHQWQSLYYALHQRFDVAKRRLRLFEVETQEMTNVSVVTFQELCQEDVIYKYQKKLKEIMDNYMINIDNK